MTNLEKIRDALNYIPADDYQTYMTIMAALQYGDNYGELDGAGYTLAREWASQSNKFDSTEFEKKWKSYRRDNDDNTVKVGTIFHLASQYGYTYKPYKDVPINLKIGDRVTMEDNKQDINDINEQRRQVLQFLRLYSPDDNINIVLNAEWNGKKWIPCDAGITKSRSEWEQIINQSTANNDMLFSLIHLALDDHGKKVSYNHSAGVWVRINPLDGKGVGNSNVTDYKYALVESDEMDKNKQLDMIKALNLPAVMINDSGGKSMHAIVKIGAKTAGEYTQNVRLLYDACKTNGFVVDMADANASRLTRLPGIRRGDNWQKTVYVNNRVQDFSEWKTAITMGVPMNLADSWQTFDPKKELAPVVIEGILRKGHKMLLGASSKAGKSMCLIELAMALATGGKWLGKQCKQSKVLYLNFEVDAPSFVNRIHKVGDALNVTPQNDNLQLWNLRGINLTLDQFVERIISYCSNRKYDVIIIDPIYKLMLGDENKAGDIARMCSAFDKIARSLNASVIYSHHYAKGNAYTNSLKSVVDRVSGSGVFGRDADAMITLTQLHYEDDNGTTAWRVDSVLREFRPMQPFNVFFMYPVHVVDNLGELDDCCYEGDAVVKGGETTGEMNANKRDKKLDALESYLHRTLETNGGRCEMVKGIRAVKLKKAANDLDISERSMYRYVEQLDGYEKMSGGYIVKSDKIGNG